MDLLSLLLKYFPLVAMSVFAVSSFLVGKMKKEVQSSFFLLQARILSSLVEATQSQWQFRDNIKIFSPIFKIPFSLVSALL